MYSIIFCDFPLFCLSGFGRFSVIASFRIFRHSVITPFCIFGSPDEERHVVDDAKQGNFHRAKPEKILFVSKLN